MILYLLVSGIAVLWWSLRDNFCCFFCLLLTLSPNWGTAFYLVTQKRMITWPVFSLFASKNSFHANTTSHCCPKVCELVHLTMPGETSGTATFVDKAKLLWTVCYFHNYGWGWFGPKGKWHTPDLNCFPVLSVSADGFCLLHLTLNS